MTIHRFRTIFRSACHRTPVPPPPLGVGRSPRVSPAGAGDAPGSPGSCFLCYSPELPFKPSPQPNRALTPCSGLDYSTGNSTGTRQLLDRILDNNSTASRDTRLDELDSHRAQLPNFALYCRPARPARRRDKSEASIIYIHYIGEAIKILRRMMFRQNLKVSL